MNPHPTLSILLVVHNQEDDIETTLNEIFDHLTTPFECVVIDDASHDDSPEIIKSVIEYHQHENTFYFEHSEPAGRGVRLNEALAQASGSILWNPAQISKLNVDKLVNAAARLHDEELAFGLMQEHQLPGKISDWLEYIKTADWPVNDCFLWNLNQIPAAQCYFQPRLNRFQSLELALRIYNEVDYTDIPNFFSIDSNAGYSNVMPDQSNRYDLLFSLLQRYDKLSIKQEFSELINEDIAKTEQVVEQENISTLLTSARKSYHRGDSSTALEAINALLDKQPEHVEGLELKIKILERLRRYVAASEIKHKLKTGIGSESNVKPSESNLTRAETEHSDNVTEESEELDQDQDQAQDQSEEVQASEPEQAQTGQKAISDSTREESAGVSDQVEKDLEKLEERTPNLELDHLDGPKISIIIPTTLDGKPFLEQCLVSIGEECNPEYTELIIIDNASLDDTFDYLEQVKEDEFFNCRVITNSENKGFAPSINQGLEKAEGEYAVIMHNDVVLQDHALDRMAALLDEHEDFGLIGPRTNHTLNPNQEVKQSSNDAETLKETQYIDSFCMMLRTKSGVAMDEEYAPAFFDDLDLCFQIMDVEKKVGIANDVEVKHRGNITTEPLGLIVESRQYWKNVAYFNEKWEMAAPVPDFDNSDPITQLCELADLINPYYPEEELLKLFEEIYSDKVKTKIMKTQFDDEVLFKLVFIMMVTEQRKVLRRLEDQLENTTPPNLLIMHLIRFYYERNIYSRCRHYISMLADDIKGPEAEIFELKIALGERDLDEAVELANDLMKKYPSNVAVLHLAGTIHKLENNPEESEKFFELARQANPFEYQKNNEKSTNLAQ